MGIIVQLKKGDGLRHEFKPVWGKNRQRNNRIQEREAKGGAERAAAGEKPGNIQGHGSNG